MSRSYKKHPIMKDNFKSSGRNKKIANQTIRKKKDLGRKKSCDYKRQYEQYDIHDYVDRFTEQDAWDRWMWEECYCQCNDIDVSTFGWHKKYGTFENYLNKHWARYFKRK